MSLLVDNGSDSVFFPGSGKTLACHYCGPGLNQGMARLGRLVRSVSVHPLKVSGFHRVYWFHLPY